jgi:hypothetical protein
MGEEIAVAKLAKESGTERVSNTSIGQILMLSEMSFGWCSESIVFTGKESLESQNEFRSG